MLQLYCVKVLEKPFQVSSPASNCYVLLSFVYVKWAHLTVSPSVPEKLANRLGVVCFAKCVVAVFPGIEFGDHTYDPASLPYHAYHDADDIYKEYSSCDHGRYAKYVSSIGEFDFVNRFLYLFYGCLRVGRDI